MLMPNVSVDENAGEVSTLHYGDFETSPSIFIHRNVTLMNEKEQVDRRQHIDIDFDHRKLA